MPNEPTYRRNGGFNVSVGFNCCATDVEAACRETNHVVGMLPATLFKTIDFKTTSSIIGAVFAELLARQVGAIVNPIEKGHPDIIPISGLDATEAELRNFPMGIEIKTTVGNIPKGTNLRAGQTRVTHLSGITWQAHHREVESLLGLIWDFAWNEPNSPFISAALYASGLVQNDWGEISGTTGRNTKVTGMRVSGKKKMGSGWIVIVDDQRFIDCYSHLLGVTLR